MEQFEKWLFYFESEHLPKFPAQPSRRHWAELAWKAALEWVLSWETDQESREIIEKELNKSVGFIDTDKPVDWKRFPHIKHTE